MGYHSDYTQKNIFWVWPNKTKRSIQRWRSKMFWEQEYKESEMFCSFTLLCSLTLHLLSKALQKVIVLLLQVGHLVSCHRFPRTCQAVALGEWFVIQKKRQKTQKEIKRKHITEHLNNNQERKMKSVCNYSRTSPAGNTQKSIWEQFSPLQTRAHLRAL